MKLENSLQELIPSYHVCPGNSLREAGLAAGTFTGRPISPTLLLPKLHGFHARADTVLETCATPLWMGTATLSHMALTGSFRVDTNDYISPEVFPVSPWDWEIEDAGAGHPGVKKHPLEGGKL